MESNSYSDVSSCPEKIENVDISQPMTISQKPLVYNYDDADANLDQWTAESSETAISDVKSTSYVHWEEKSDNTVENQLVNNGEHSHADPEEDPEIAKNLEPEPCLIIDESLDAEIGNETVIVDDNEQNLASEGIEDQTDIVYENCETEQEVESEFLVVDEEEDQTVSVSHGVLLHVTDVAIENSVLPCQSIVENDDQAQLLESEGCSKNEAAEGDVLDPSYSCGDVTGSIETASDEAVAECKTQDTASQPKEGNNYQAILEDWDADGIGSDSIKEELVEECHDEGEVLTSSVPKTPACTNHDSNDQSINEEVPCAENEIFEEMKVVHTFSTSIENPCVDNKLPNSDRNGNDKFIGIQRDFSGKKISSKDLLLAIDLIQRTSAVDTSEMNRDEIIGILEGDQVGDWRKSISSSQNKAGNDLDIKKEVSSTLDQKKVEAYARRGQAKRKYIPRKPRVPQTMDKDTERELALKQLATFNEGNKKRRNTQVVKDAPVVAAADLGRALASTPLVAGKKRRQPCYKPVKEVKEEGENQIVKTYAVKPNSAPDITEVETGLQTIAIVNKHLREGNANEETSVPSLSKKVVKKKRTRELQQLLGDEGAVKMIYETSQKDSQTDGHPTFQRTKKGLEQKSKFVENAVIRLSGSAEKSLRGKRVKQNEAESSSPDDALFPPSVPGVGPSVVVSTPARSRKKPKPAEASRILYRHSSSESFDGSEGMRRTPSEIAGLDMSPEKVKSASPSPRKLDVTSQRKSSRARKVNAKFSAYVAETLTPKRVRKVEDERTLIKQELSETLVSGNGENTSGTEEAAIAISESSSTTLVERRPSSVDISEICLNRAGGLVEITLTSTNPRIKNSFTADVLNQLEAGLKAADKDPTCRAILLTTEGTPFCQGIDLCQLAPGSDVSLLINALRSAVLTLANVEKPVVVGVQGAAIGLGVALLPLCDVVIASEASKFSTPYSRLGQGLEGAASFTFPAIGRALVSELVYKGVELTAAEAYQFGLVSQVVPTELFHTELVQIAHAVASQSCQGLRIAKSQMTDRHRGDIIDALDRECTALESAWTSAEWLGAAADLLASGDLILNT